MIFPSRTAWSTCRPWTTILSPALANMALPHRSEILATGPGGLHDAPCLAFQGSRVLSLQHQPQPSPPVGPKDPPEWSLPGESDDASSTVGGCGEQVSVNPGRVW